MDIKEKANALRVDTAVKIINAVMEYSDKLSINAPLASVVANDTVPVWRNILSFETLAGAFNAIKETGIKKVNLETLSKDTNRKLTKSKFISMITGEEVKEPRVETTFESVDEEVTKE